jgi:hypothetical protein
MLNAQIDLHTPCRGPISVGAKARVLEGFFGGVEVPVGWWGLGKAVMAVTLSGDRHPEMLSGDVLLSHTVTSAVPSAQTGLASGFGMGPGVSLSL